MDAIKKQWNVIVQQRFWVLSGLVFLSTIGVFYICSSKLSSEIAARTKIIDDTFGKISTIRGTVESHPNSHSHAQMDKAVGELEQDILKAWQKKFELQIPLMVWPRAAFNSESTWKIFTTLRPVEKYIDFPLPTPLPAPFNKITVTDRNVYKQYIGPEFKGISKKIGTEWKAQLGGAGGGLAGGMEGGDGFGSGMGGPGMGGPAGMGGGFPGGPGGAGMTGALNESLDVVRWTKESQQTLLQQVAPWYGRVSPPTILDIYYTQEDMWLLAAIMEIIKKTNGDARENFETVVKEIEWIRMGKFASRNAGVLTKGQSSSMGYGQGPGGFSEGGAMGMEGGMGMEGEMGKGPGGESEGGMGGEGMAMGGPPGSEGGLAMTGGLDPCDNRYISFAEGTEFQPRKGDEVRESIRNISPTNAVDAVAKRVPIRMRLKVDPSRLTRLITACGNAAPMLEVYQVRLNTEAAPATGAPGGGMGGGGDGYDGGMKGGPMGMGGMGMGMGTPGMGEGSGESGGGFPGLGAAGAVGADAMSEVSVEIFGLMYLYNPENIGTLGNEMLADKPEDGAPAPQAKVSPPSNPAEAPAILGGAASPNGNSGDAAGAAEPSQPEVKSTEGGEQPAVKEGN